MKFRNSLVVLHRWMSLGVGVFWSVAALTGGILVFGPEIDRLVNGGRFDVAESELAGAPLDRVLVEQFPAASIRSLRWLREDHVISMEYNEGGQIRRVFLDANTANPVEEIRPRTELMAAVQRAHVTLLAGRVGNRIVALTSAITVLSVLIGIVLWWPGIRTLGRGFTIRLRRGAYLFNFDLHRTLGAVTVLLLLLMTGTGVILGSPRVSRRLAVVLFPGEDPPPIPAAPQLVPGIPTPGVEALVATAEDAAGGQIMALEFPARRPDLVLARIDTDPDRTETMTVYLARSDGRVLTLREPGALGPQDRFGRFNSRLHTGRFPSLAVRILYSLACFLGVGLAVTGFTVWWLKRTRKRHSRRLRAEAVPA